jgi:hypothetical protein
VKIAQPLFILGLIGILGACAPIHTAEAPPPPPPPQIAPAPPPVATAPAPAAEVPYVEPAPRWHRYAHRHRAWCRCGPVRHHHWRHHRRWRSSMGAEPEPADQAGSSGVITPGSAPTPAATGPRY